MSSAGYFTDFIQPFVAQGAIAKKRIVKLAADGLKVEVATDGTVPLAGVSFQLDHVDGDPIDVARELMPEVAYGDDVTVNAPLTAGAGGKAVPAQAGDWYLGFAQSAGADGDIGLIYIAPGKLEAA